MRQVHYISPLLEGYWHSNLRQPTLKRRRTTAENRPSKWEGDDTLALARRTKKRARRVRTEETCDVQTKATKKVRNRKNMSTWLSRAARDAPATTALSGGEDEGRVEERNYSGVDLAIQSSQGRSCHDDGGRCDDDATTRGQCQ